MKEVKIKEWIPFDAFKYWKEVKIKNKEGVVITTNNYNTFPPKGKSEKT